MFRVPVYTQFYCSSLSKTLINISAKCTQDEIGSILLSFCVSQGNNKENQRYPDA